MFRNMKHIVIIFIPPRICFNIHGPVDPSRRVRAFKDVLEAFDYRMDGDHELSFDRAWSKHFRVGDPFLPIFIFAFLTSFMINDISLRDEKSLTRTG